MIRITAKNDIRCFKKGDTIELDRFPTVMVGSNGSGKSTIFNAIRGVKNSMDENVMYASDFRELSKNFDIVHDYDNVFVFDADKDSGKNMSVAIDAVEFINWGGFHANRKSHGEGTIIFLDVFMGKLRDADPKGRSLIVLDEFDTGFSPLFQAKAFDVATAIAKKHDADLIMVTHNIIAMLQAETVYNMNMKMYMSSTSYLMISTMMDFGGVNKVEPKDAEG